MSDGSTVSQDGYHGGSNCCQALNCENRTVVVKPLEQSPAVRSEVRPEPPESATGGTRSHFQGSP